MVTSTNRAARRHPDKAAQVRQIMSDISTMSKLHRSIEDGYDLHDGDKVTLNLKRITERPDYQDKNPKYREFCESNEGRVFTVRLVEGMHNSVVCLDEDESEPKWLFWDGDLKKVQVDKT